MMEADGEERMGGIKGGGGEFGTTKMETAGWKKN
jgi:hypothetical protein